MGAPKADIPTRSPRKEHALALFSGLGRRYDAVGALMSFGQDPRWRRELVCRLPAAPGDRVLDVATGTGLVAEALAERYGCSVVGLDQSEGMLQGARARLAARPELAGRIELVAGEAERLPFADGEFDAVSFTYLLRYVDDVPATLAELARMVKPGGRIASLEFGVPRAGALRALWSAYCRIGLPAIGRVVSRDWQEVGRFLGPSIEGFARRWPPERLADAWRDAGIGAVAVRRMSFGAGVVMAGVRDGDSR